MGYDYESLKPKQTKFHPVNEEMEDDEEQEIDQVVPTQVTQIENDFMPSFSDANDIDTNRDENNDHVIIVFYVD